MWILQWEQLKYPFFKLASSTSAISKKQQSPSELWLLKCLTTKTFKLVVNLTQLFIYPSETNDP